MSDFEIGVTYALLFVNIVAAMGVWVATFAAVGLIMDDTLKSLKLRFNNKPNG